MTSFIVTSSNKNKKEEYINEFLQNEKIDKFDVTHIGIESSKNQNSIGIDEIKDLQIKIFLKPIKSQKKAIIINNGDLLTIEAQNALLKVLEEPPSHTIIVLSVENSETLLPTILSRCQIVTIANEELKLTTDEKIEFEKFIESISILRVGEKLKIAEDLAKDKEKAISWIGKLILTLRGKMLTKESEAYNEIVQIKYFQDLYVVLKTTNVNPRFAIENTLLNITA